MVLFNSDYMEGCHPRILQLLCDTNMVQQPGYETDEYCEKARDLIKKACGSQDIDVQFLAGGTLTNLVVIGAALRPHQGVISVDAGHIAVHETGAIEATGHKVLTIPSADGKLTAQQIRQYYDAHWNDVTHEHIVQPGMVYISNPTELGSIYTKAELTEISKVCRECGLYLFMDGARLGYGLTAEGNDLDLPTITQLCDVFYIGGNKVGAIVGEAVVISHPDLKRDFRYHMKQRGGLSAKGRLLGIQFVGLFENGLYFEIAAHANRMALLIRKACEDKGIGFLTPSPTNQQFPILPDSDIEKLGKEWGYSYCGATGEGTSAIRFCTSWATQEQHVLELCEDIRSL